MKINMTHGTLMLAVLLFCMICSVIAVQCKYWCKCSIQYLDMSTGVDLVHGLARRLARLTVKVVTLHIDTVVTETQQPHVTLAMQVQLHTLAYMQPESTPASQFKHLQYRASISTHTVYNLIKLFIIIKKPN